MDWQNLSIIYRITLYYFDFINKTVVKLKRGIGPLIK